MTLKSGFWKLSALCLLIIAAAVATPSIAMQGDAIVVLGQLDFASNSINTVTSASMYQPFSVAVDTSAVPNRLYVADTFNNGVLGWRDVTAFANGALAELVIGQPDFVSSATNNPAGARERRILLSGRCGGRSYGQSLRGRLVK